MLAAGSLFAWPHYLSLMQAMILCGWAWQEPDTAQRRCKQAYEKHAVGCWPVQRPLQHRTSAVVYQVTSISHANCILMPVAWLGMASE
jgi:hypothetical protein